MGKHDPFSPKGIANRIKSKGLQKLRWYCQLCNKQCRDENGFKCHQTSESHLRQMELFGQNAEKVVDEYTKEFEETFLEHLRRAHPFSRVSANVVYNEYIQDKHHLHMNSTSWLTLTDFVKHLGRTGKCKVDETPKGWFIALVQADPMKELADKERIKRATHEREEEERHMSELTDQIERAKKMARVDDAGGAAMASELVRDESAGPLRLGLTLTAAAAAGAAEAGPAGMAQARAGVRLPAAGIKPAAAAAAFGDDDEPGPSSRAGGAAPSGRGPSKVHELMQKDLAAKAQAAERAAANASSKGGASSSGRIEAWLVPGIVVKVVAPELKQHGYYKQKGVVERVVDKYLGEVAMIDSGDVVRVDVAHLETVLPAPGGRLLVVNGPHRGARAELLSIDIKRFQAQVRLTDGPSKGQELWQEYEDVCKLAQQ